jgi:regulator of protease activity HflC (stomatin/prohibitin superfamily)
MSSLPDLVLISVVLVIHLGTFAFAYKLSGRGEAALRFTILSAATIVLALMGNRWNGLIGALFLPLLAHLFFWTSLTLVSQSLFPVLDWRRRLGAIEVLVSLVFAYHRSSYIVDGKVSERIPGHATPRAGSGVVLVGVAQAAVLHTTTRFSRAVGPGVAFVHQLERVKTAVDLRTQTRSTRVKAHTKDAVSVETNLHCLFRISNGTRPAAPAEDFPFSERAVGQVIYGREGADYSWDDYALQVTTARFREILARFRLDQLFASGDTDQEPRTVLHSSLNAAVRSDLAKRGIDLVSAGFDCLDFPEPVQAQRMASWQAEWAKRAGTSRAAGTTDTDRPAQSARAAPRRELVQGLMRGISAAQGLAAIDPSDLIAGQLLDAIESMTADPHIRCLLSQKTLDSVQAIRGQIAMADSP